MKGSSTAGLALLLAVSSPDVRAASDEPGMPLAWAVCDVCTTFVEERKQVRDIEGGVLGRKEGFRLPVITLTGKAPHSGVLLITPESFRVIVTLPPESEEAAKLESAETFYPVQSSAVGIGDDKWIVQTEGRQACIRKNVDGAFVIRLVAIVPAKALTARVEIPSAAGGVLRLPRS
jgi:hypothetical protein